MKPRLLLNLFTFVTLAILVAPTAQARPDVDEETASLHREIAALRIVHGLDLSSAQIEELIPLVRTGIGLREDLEGVMEKSSKANLSVLERVRDDLSDDGELTDETETAAQDAHKSVEKALRPVNWELQDLGEEVMDLFDEDQKQKVKKALARPPFGQKQRGGPEREPDGEEGAMGPPSGVREPRMPPGMEQGVRRHNTRHLLGVVFSEEFLAVLQDQI